MNPHSSSDLGVLVDTLGHNWVLVILGSVVIWLLFTRLVETSEAAAKLFGPLGRRIVSHYQMRQARYRADVALEAKLVAIELVPKVIPADYEMVKNQLQNIIERVGDLEVENSALRAFVIYDEEWHFQDKLEDVKRGRGEKERITWLEFLARWKTGWRPPILQMSEAQVRALQHPNHTKEDY